MFTKPVAIKSFKHNAYLHIAGCTRSVRLLRKMRRSHSSRCGSPTHPSVHSPPFWTPGASLISASNTPAPPMQPAATNAIRRGAKSSERLTRRDLVQGELTLESQRQINAITDFGRSVPHTRSFSGSPLCETQVGRIQRVRENQNISVITVEPVAKCCALVRRELFDDLQDSSQPAHVMVNLAVSFHFEYMTNEPADPRHSC